MKYLIGALISMAIAAEIEVGQLYQHYKGKRYEIIAIGLHTESLEKYVVYRALYNDPEFGNNALWIRPLSMFVEQVTIGGKTIPRFTLVS